MTRPLLIALLFAATASAGPVPVGSAAPQAAITALDGREMSVASARGHWLLITFSDYRSREAGWAFFKAHAPRFAQVPGLVVHNVIVPGGVALAPRAVVLMRLRSDTARLQREVRDGLPEKDRARFDATDVRWHADFDRHYSERFGAPPHQVSAALVDPAGRLAAFEDAVSGSTVERLLALARPK